MVWSHLSPVKSLLVVVVSGEWQTKFSVSPDPGLWSLVLGAFGADLELTWDLDLSLTKKNIIKLIFEIEKNLYIND